MNGARPFFPDQVNYTNCGPLVPMVWKSLNFVKTGRVMFDETNPAEFKLGTIRADFCIQDARNIIHGSDAVESANKEIKVLLSEKELTGLTPAGKK